MFAQQPRAPHTHKLPGYDLPPIPAHGTRVILVPYGDRVDPTPQVSAPAPLSGVDPAGGSVAGALGRYLAHCPITAVYTSPHQGPQQLAAALLPHLKVPIVKSVTVDPRLREIHLPAWKGDSLVAVQGHVQGADHGWQATPDQLPMTVGAARSQAVDPVRELYSRAHQFWLATLPQHRGHTLLVMGHDTSHQALINTALGRSPRQFHTCQQTHSGLTVLDFIHPTARPARLQVLNATLHPGLPELQAGRSGLRLLLLPQAGQVPPPDLGPWLGGEPIHGAIVADALPLPDRSHPGGSQRWLQTLLQQHPETVLLSAPEAAFGTQWQQSIQRSRRTTDGQTLTTVLAIAGLPALQACMNTLFHLPATATTFALKPQHLTVVHYPTTRPHPILQGLNLRPG